MDITKFIISSREEALLYGDYNTYCTRLSRRLRNCRKHLNIATKNRGKYHPRGPVTAEQIAENPEYLRLALMTAERAFADAMKMKATHTADAKGISGRARSQIVSALTKSAKAAGHLADALAQDGSGAGQVDVLEALAYAALLNGATQFEKQAWAPCLRNYAVARVIYGALSSSSRGDVFKDLLSETIDPSIRYAAYQLKTPRSLPIPAIAREAFPDNDKELVARINNLDPAALAHTGQTEKSGLSRAESAARSISWRSREVRIEDAAIATAWAALGVARASLEKKLVSAQQLDPKDTAAAYDDVLTASQDAVDATKQAIDELRGDGVSQSDPRMQSLYVTRTAVNYEMISWRIGRNRVLTGEHDGALEAGVDSSRKTSKRKSATDATTKDPPGRQIARLKEKVVLYDGTLQSLETVKELPGVAADEDLSSQLEATFQYFNSLKCLAIARSYSIAGNQTNALALVKHGHDQSQASLSGLTTTRKRAESNLRNIEISQDDVKFIQNLLRGELQRYRGLVEVESLQKQSAGGSATAIPLGEKLGEYPAEPVDLDNIVAYPPRLEVIPVKPIFLDVAWNYIDYPDKAGKSVVKGKDSAADSVEQKPQKRGWFWSSR